MPLNLYVVTANDAHDYFIADSEADACEMMAIEAGYESVADMECRLNEPSEMVASIVPNHQIHAVMEELSIEPEQNWNDETTIYHFGMHAICVSGPIVTFQ